MAAFNLGGFKTGSFTLMSFLAEKAAGRALLILWAAALSGYVFWRVYESIADKREFGNDLTGIAERIGFGFGGLVYAFLGVSALLVALNPQTSSWLKETDMQQLIQTDLGKYTVMAIAVGMLGATLNEFYIAISRKFSRTIAIERLEPIYRKLILTSGMIGYASRGITLGIASFLLWDSAFTNRDLEDTNKEAIVLTPSMDYGSPRNIYGVTKKAAEKICLNNEKLNIAILRCSRFFVEDAFDTVAKPSDRNKKGCNGNTKANEMLKGVRSSLEDMVMAHLVALVRISTNTENLHKIQKIGPLIVSSISPLLYNAFSTSLATASNLYKTLVWSLPDNIRRVYDSRGTWEVLDWSPRWDFERLIIDFDERKNVEIIKEGRY